MFLPFHTDAPIYYWPFATVGLIAVNILVFFATTYGVGEFEYTSLTWLMLEFDSINPLQWLTSNFMHASVFHLLGNMFFLWSFALVVEGKIGWLKFLAIYLTIGIVYGAIIQLAMYLLGGTAHALGASAVIFGVLGVAIVWAPRNEMTCVLRFGVLIRTVQVPIFMLGIIYLGLQILPFFFRGIHMSSQMLHLVGLAVGIPIGIFMLIKGWVDCEGWDLFSVWQGKETKLISEQRAEARETIAAAGVKKQKKRQTAIRQQQSDELEAESAPIDQNAVVARSIQQALNSENVNVALAIHGKQSDTNADWRIPDRVLANLIQGLHRQNRWHESVPFMIEIIQRLPDRTAGARIKLAQIMLQIENRPRQALHLLSKLPPQLSDEQRQQALAIQRAAEQEAAGGAIEVYVEDW